ncbi:hypothetical protein NDU88_006303 [Pleurodeles waltl]|uniref:Uncharacterized protein n=1 Tax=Pleurodeles waltl TaxID=8319 RepID=A0AAV7LNQ9_PLEWA|nr:hypothetical protein NDU88_006303 [Pleurodeles waltl]
MGRHKETGPWGHRKSLVEMDTERARPRWPRWTQKEPGPDGHRKSPAQMDTERARPRWTQKEPGPDGHRKSPAQMDRERARPRWTEKEPGPDGPDGQRKSPAQGTQKEPSPWDTEGDWPKENRWCRVQRKEKDLFRGAREAAKASGKKTSCARPAKKQRQEGGEKTQWVK